MRVRATAPPYEPRLVDRWRGLGMITDERLGLSLERAARRWPSRTAVIDGIESVTFGELAARSDVVAAGLLERGVGRGDVVTWSLPNGVDAVCVAAATWRIGAISNPVVTIYRSHELRFVLDQLRPAAVVGPVEHRGRSYCEEIDMVLEEIDHRPRARLCAGSPPPPGWDDLGSLTPAGSAPPAALAAPAAEPCLVLYTSGTTAAPKGVVHSGQTLGQEVRSMREEWGLSWRDVMFMASPLTHITGILQGLLVPATTGAKSVLLDRWDPELAVEMIEREGATYMAGATPFLAGLVDRYAALGSRSSLRQFCCGGAAVPPGLIERAEEFGICAYRAWGMTELPTATLSSELDPLKLRARTDGRPAEGVEVEAVDEQRRALPAGELGELRARGPERMVGYVDPALNADALDAEGWLYSGDLGRVDRDNGFVTVTGRLKEIINRGGEKFSAREIEGALVRHPRLREAAVVGAPGGPLGERVCAAVVGDVAEEDDLRSFLVAEGLAKQKVPESIRIVTDLPRTAAGKVQRQVVVEMFEGSR